MKHLFITLVAIILWVSQANAQNPGNRYQSHDFQYLTGVLTSSQPTTSPVANAWNSVAPPQHYSMNVTTTASGFNVYLEGSLDNSNWSQISVTNSAIGVISNVNPMPMLYFRMRQSGLSSGAAVTATAVGVPY